MNKIKKVAIITGASSGLGFAIANKLIAEDWIVYSLSRKFKNDNNINFIECDITNFDSVKKVFLEIKNKHEAIDLLVNNSGYGLFGLIEKIPFEQIKQQIDVNVLGTINVVNHLLSFFPDQQTHIINIASIVVSYNLPYMTMYVASKKAVVEYTKWLKNKLIKQSIVQALILGPVKTNFQKNKLVYANEDYLLNEQINKTLIKMEKNSKEKGLSTSYVVEKIYKKIIFPQKSLFIYDSFKTFFLCKFIQVLPNKIGNKLSCLIFK